MSLPNLTIILRARFSPPTQQTLIRVNVFMAAGKTTPQLVGRLLLNVGEWQLFGAALLIGANSTNGQLAVDVREDPLTGKVDP